MTAELFLRDSGGAGLPFVILHGGWGYQFYPYDHAIAALSGEHRFVIPDRTGAARDPRTEPGELDRLRREVPAAEIHLLPGAGHSPHGERGSSATCTALAAAFLRSLTASR